MIRAPSWGVLRVRGGRGSLRGVLSWVGCVTRSIEDLLPFCISWLYFNCNTFHLAILLVLLRDVVLRGSSRKLQPSARWALWGPWAARTLVFWLRFNPLEVFRGSLGPLDLRLLKDRIYLKCYLLHYIHVPKDRVCIHCNIIYKVRLSVLPRDVGLRGSSRKLQPSARWASWGPCAVWTLVYWFCFEPFCIGTSILVLVCLHWMPADPNPTSGGGVLRFYGGGVGGLWGGSSVGMGCGTPNLMEPRTFCIPQLW